MALTSVQQHQAARIPIVDATLDSDDFYAFGGVVFPLTSAPSLSSTLLKQAAGIPIVDASLDEDDGYAFARAPQSGGGGNTTDVFSLNWVIDPTWLTSEPEVTVDGAFGVIIRGFGVGFTGIAGDRPAGGPEGYGGESMYNSESQRRKRKKKRLEELRQEIRNMNRWR